MTVTVKLHAGHSITLLNVTTLADLRKRLQAMGIVRVKGGSEMSEWQPIETAPKDGRYILAYRPNAFRRGDAAIVICRSMPTVQFAWDGGENFTDRANTATHWMPLPEPPK